MLDYHLHIDLDLINHSDYYQFWDVKAQILRNCLILVGRGKYTDSGGHVEGDRDMDCLDQKTWEATASGAAAAKSKKARR